MSKVTTVGLSMGINFCLEMLGELEVCRDGVGVEW